MKWELRPRSVERCGDSAVSESSSVCFVGASCPEERHGPRLCHENPA